MIPVDELLSLAVVVVVSQHKFGLQTGPFSSVVIVATTLATAVRILFLSRAFLPFSIKQCYMEFHADDSIRVLHDAFVRRQQIRHGVALSLL